MNLLFVSLLSVSLNLYYVVSVVCLVCLLAVGCENVSDTIDPSDFVSKLVVHVLP